MLVGGGVICIVSVMMDWQSKFHQKHSLPTIIIYKACDENLHRCRNVLIAAETDNDGNGRECIGVPLLAIQ